MTKASSGEMIELHFDDEFVVEWLPFHRALGAPAAEAAGSFAREAGRLDQLLQLLSDGSALFSMNRRSETDVIEFSFGIVEAEQQGADQLLFCQVAKTTYDTIGGALCLDLLHPRAFAGPVRQVFVLCDYSVEADAHVEPSTGDTDIVGRGRQT